MDAHESLNAIVQIAEMDMLRLGSHSSLAISPYPIGEKIPFGRFAASAASN